MYGAMITTKAMDPTEPGAADLVAETQSAAVRLVHYFEAGDGVLVFTSVNICSRGFRISSTR